MGPQSSGPQALCNAPRCSAPNWRKISGAPAFSLGLTTQIAMPSGRSAGCSRGQPGGKCIDSGGGMGFGGGHGTLLLQRGFTVWRLRRVLCPAAASDLKVQSDEEGEKADAEQESGDLCKARKANARRVDVQLLIRPA